MKWQKIIFTITAATFSPDTKVAAQKGKKKIYLVFKPEQKQPPQKTFSFEALEKIRIENYREEK